MTRAKGDGHLPGVCDICGGPTSRKRYKQCAACYTRAWLSHEDKFWSMVKIGSADDCWLWMGKVNNSGYGSIHVKPKPKGPTLVHRYAYELLVGPIPEGRELDHRCRNRRCVNPAHLELVTRSENCKRGDSGLAWAAHQRRKTHCPQGHPYDLFNTYYDKNGGRQCLICKRERAKESYLRKRGNCVPVRARSI